MLRTKKRDPVFLERMENRLGWQLRMRGATLFGHALLAAVHGDRETARTLAASVRTLSPRVVLWPVSIVTNEWIMMEAAVRGDWAAVHERGRRAQRITWTSSLLFGVASRLLGEPYRFAGPRLWLSWMLAGSWLTTWPLLRRGLFEKPAASRAGSLETSFDEEDLVRGALRLHVAVLRTPPKKLRSEQIRTLGRAWDAALDDVSMRERFVARSTSLAVLPSEEPLSAMRETVESDLVAILQQARIPLALWRDEGQLLADVAATLREELIDEAEQAARALRRRAEAKKELPAIEEWRQWLSARDIYERAGELGGLELRRLAFSQVHHDLCNYGVWLFNVQDEKPIANAIFTWLLAEAKAVDDAAATVLQHGNVKAGCGY